MKKVYCKLGKIKYLVLMSIFSAMGGSSLLAAPVKIEPKYDFNAAITGIVANADALFAKIGPIVLTVVGFGILIGFIKLVRQR